MLIEKPEYYNWILNDDRKVNITVKFNNEFTLFEEPLFIFKISNVRNIKIFVNESKEEQLFDGMTDNYILDTPNYYNGLYFEKFEDNTDEEVDISIYGKYGELKDDYRKYEDIIYSDLVKFENTTEGMDSFFGAADDSTYSLSLNFSINYKGNSYNDLYMSSNSWIGFGSATEHIKIYRRDCYSNQVYKQEGIANDKNFIKIRYSGWSVYNSRTDSNYFIYEIFIFENGDIFLNIIQSPTSTRTDWSNSVDGQNLDMSKKKMFIIAQSDNTFNIYNKETDIIKKEDDKYFLLKDNNVYYTIDNENNILKEIKINDSLNLRAVDFIEFGSLVKPTSEILISLSEPKIMLWCEKNKNKFKENVKAQPKPMSIVKKIDMSNELIIGFISVSGSYTGNPTISFSNDNQFSYIDEQPFKNWLDYARTDINNLWKEIINKYGRIFYIRITLKDDDTFKNLIINYQNEGD